METEKTKKDCKEKRVQDKSARENRVEDRRRHDKN